MLGWAVKRAREERGWTIERLAEESGLGRRTVLTVESGEKSANIETLHALAWALEVPLSGLVAPLDQPPRSRTNSERPR